jgi:hypothetical protein
MLLTDKCGAHLLISTLSLPANSVFASPPPPHDMRACVPHTLCCLSVPHPPAPLGVYPGLPWRGFCLPLLSGLAMRRHQGN